MWCVHFEDQWEQYGKSSAIFERAGKIYIFGLKWIFGLVLLLIWSKKKLIFSLSKT